jgi:hypothetical protein
VVAGNAVYAPLPWIQKNIFLERGLLDFVGDSRFLAKWLARFPAFHKFHA